MNALSVDTPLGRLYLAEENGALRASSFLCAPMGAQMRETPVLSDARAQIQAYFAGERACFDMPVDPAGTAFERSVWQALRGIGFGQTRTYGEIAAALGKPGAARAVGRACGKNPLLIVIPCHRVIGSGGKMTGFAAGIEIKRALLSLERADIHA